MMLAGQFRGTPLENLQWLGFFIVVSGTFITTILFEIITRHYLHIRLMLYPSNTTLHLFVEPKGITSKEVIRNFFVTRLKLHWPVEHPYYGKNIRELKIHHHLHWAERVLPEGGVAVFQGNIIDHAQSVTLICFESRTSSDKYKGTAIPSFMLAFAPKMDSNFPIAIPQILEVIARNGGNLEQLPKILAGGKAYEKMYQAYIEKNEEANYYRAQALQSELAEQSHRSETNALLKNTMDVEERAWKNCLDLYTKYGDFDKACKARPGWFKQQIGKWAIIGLAIIVAGMIVIVNPALFSGIGPWLTQNSLLVGGLAVAACVFGYLFFEFQKRRR